jgi:hypothetical protein
MLPLPIRTATHVTILLLGLAGVAIGAAPTAADLVSRLGDPSFAERERASEAILRLGRGAVPALESGLQSSDAEVRRRVAELLPLARRSDLDVRFDSFIAGDDEPPLPGWNRFRQLAGDDRSARCLFVSLGRNEPALLETLEKEPAQVGNQLAERTRRMAARSIRRPVADAADQSAAADALLLVAACSTEKNSAAAQQFYNCLYQPDMRSAVRGNVAAQRLLTPFLSRQLDQPWRIHQAVWLARNLGLDEFTENTLKPAARKQAVAAAARAGEPNGLMQAASLATMLGLSDTMETVLKPAARQLAESALEKPDDPARLYQVLNLLQTLNMQDEIDSTLRPAASEAIAGIARKPYDQYRFQLALNLAKSLKLDEPLEQVLKPAAVKALIDACKELPNNPSQLNVALNLVQTFELNAARDDFLKPAVRRLAVAAANSGDFMKLNTATRAVTSLALTDVVNDTLRPAVHKLAAADASEDPERLSRLIAMAEKLGMKDTIDTVLKPRVRQGLRAAVDRPIGQNLHSYLQLARSLAIKDGVPLALKAAQTKSLSAGSRGTALLFVAEFGDKSDIPRLEGLLTDTTVVGSIGLNFDTIHTEVRDVALAAVVSLSGQSPADYDFPYLRFFGGAMRGLSSQSAHCFGFCDKASREAALKKWKERSTAKNDQSG